MTRRAPAKCAEGLGWCTVASAVIEVGNIRVIFVINVTVRGRP